MDREILFRGKTVPTEDCESEWIEGDLLSNAYPIPNIRPLGDVCCYRVIPETVGQYTGLTDKFDEKVFEGDYVLDEADEEIGIVKFDAGEFVVCFGNVIDGNRFEDIIASCHVIGNIHDNPELLKMGGLIENAQV